MRLPTVELTGVTVAYPGAEPALAGVDLVVDDGSFFGVLGPSGSGKTTLVRVIAGLERPAAGRVLIDGADMTGVDASKRNLAMVFQDWALYPHKSAGKNIAFPMELRGDDPEAVERRVAEVARSLALGGLLDRRPSELSAGHRHGVATGRALAGDRPLLLMDEPLANLDATRRRQVRMELARLHAESGMTVVYATNDQEEVLALADTAAVLDRGVVQQVAPPQALYHRPANMFVAGFIGSPAMNLARAAVVADGAGVALLVGSRRLDLDGAAVERLPGLRARAGGEVIVGVRAEHLHFGGTIGGAPEQRLGGEVRAIEFLGSEQLVHFGNDAIAADGSAGTEWVARIPADAPVRRGEHVALAVDVARISCFDRADGEALIRS